MTYFNSNPKPEISMIDIHILHFPKITKNWSSCLTLPSFEKLLKCSHLLYLLQCRSQLSLRSPRYDLFRWWKENKPPIESDRPSAKATTAFCAKQKTFPAESRQLSTTSSPRASVTVTTPLPLAPAFLQLAPRGFHHCAPLPLPLELTELGKPWIHAQYKHWCLQSIINFIDTFNLLFKYILEPGTSTSIIPIENEYHYPSCISKIQSTTNIDNVTTPNST